MSSVPRSDLLQAAVIGCGRIGGQNDETRVEACKDPITHAGAYAAHPRFALAACVEPDPARRAAFAAHWGVEHVFGDLDQLLNSGVRIDVVSVASPTSDHSTTLRRLLDSQVRAVLTEKPLTATVADSRNVVEAYERASKPLLVNFTRRWNPTFVDIRRQIEGGAFGRPLSAVGFYTKGICHNGIHLIDLLQYFLGPLFPVSVCGARVDHDVDDPAVDAMLKTSEGVPVHIVAGDARRYGLLELAIVFEYGSFAIEEGGLVLRTRPVRANRTSPDQKDLGRGEFVETGWRQQFLMAMDDLANLVAGRDTAVSTGRTALAAQEVCTALASMIGKG